MIRWLRWLYGAIFLRPRQLLTPGIRAEVTIVMGDGGQIAVYHSKLDPGDNPSLIFGAMLMRWLAFLSLNGVTLDFAADDGRSVPLVRPHAGSPSDAPQL